MNILENVRIMKRKFAKKILLIKIMRNIVFSMGLTTKNEKDNVFMHNNGKNILNKSLHTKMLRNIQAKQFTIAKAASVHGFRACLFSNVRC